MQKYVTDTRYTPLALLDMSGGRMRFVDLLNQTCAASGITPLQGKSLLKTMRAQKLISGTFQAGTYVRLEPSGSELLQSIRSEAKAQLQLAEEKGKQTAKDERQQRFNNKIAVATLLIQLVSFIFGILAEHYVGIFNWISALFH